MLKIEAEETGNLGDAIDEAVHATELGVLKHCAADVRREAIDSMHFADGPAPRGEPPHAHRGRLRRATVYHVDEAEMTAEIGQANIQEALIARKLEKTHPFMGPALVAANEKFSQPAFQ